MKSLLIALAQVMMRAALTETVRRALPEIYKRLDAEVPLLLINNAPSFKIAGVIASAISDSTGKRASTSQVRAIISLYDPVRAAKRNHF